MVVVLLEMMWSLNPKYTKFVKVGLKDGVALVTIVSNGGKNIVEIDMDYGTWTKVLKEQSFISHAVETKSKFGMKIENSDTDYCLTFEVRNVFGKHYLQIKDRIVGKQLMLDLEDWTKLCMLIPVVTNYVTKLNSEEESIARYVATFDGSMQIDPPEALQSVWPRRLQDEVLAEKMKKESV
jgi:hypothetical protein